MVFASPLVHGEPTKTRREAEPVLHELSQDHVLIKAKARLIVSALDERRFLLAADLTADLAEIFSCHMTLEETTVFARLKEAGQDSDRLGQLENEHRRIRFGLLDVAAVEQPHNLRRLLDDLVRNADTEERDLFPLARRVLSVEDRCR